jgi:hypothetical protein
MDRPADTATERRSDDIVAHIFYAVGSTSQVTVTTPEGEFTGALEYPDGDGILIRAHDPLPSLRAGTPVCVEYSGGLDAYRFYTEVLTARDGQLFLTMPHAIECADRRLAERVKLTADAPFHIRLHGQGVDEPQHIDDISVGGVAFVDPTPRGLPIRQRIDAELLLPGEGERPLACAIEVRNLALRRGRLTVGARLVSLALADRARLARAILGWVQAPRE